MSLRPVSLNPSEDSFLWVLPLSCLNRGDSHYHRPTPSCFSSVSRGIDGEGRTYNEHSANMGREEDGEERKIMKKNIKKKRCFNSYSWHALGSDGLKSDAGMYWERLALVRWRRKGENRGRGREGSRFYPEVVVQSIRRSWLLPYCGQTILTHMYYCLVLYLCTTKIGLIIDLSDGIYSNEQERGGGGRGKRRASFQRSPGYTNFRNIKGVPNPKSWVLSYALETLSGTLRAETQDAR